MPDRDETLCLEYIYDITTHLITINNTCYTMEKVENIVGDDKHQWSDDPRFHGKDSRDQKQCRSQNLPEQKVAGRGKTSLSYGDEIPYFFRRNITLVIGTERGADDIRRHIGMGVKKALVNFQYFVTLVLICAGEQGEQKTHGLH